MYFMAMSAFTRGSTAVDAAWREGLDDPHYVERRHLEERKRVVVKARAAAANH